MDVLCEALKTFRLTSITINNIIDPLPFFSHWICHHHLLVIRLKFFSIQCTHQHSVSRQCEIYTWSVLNHFPFLNLDRNADSSNFLRKQQTQIGIRTEVFFIYSLYFLIFFNFDFNVTTCVRMHQIVINLIHNVLLCVQDRHRHGSLGTQECRWSISSDLPQFKLIRVRRCWMGGASW